MASHLLCPPHELQDARMSSCPCISWFMGVLTNCCSHRSQHRMQWVLKRVALCKGRFKVNHMIGWPHYRLTRSVMLLVSPCLVMHVTGRSNLSLGHRVSLVHPFYTRLVPLSNWLYHLLDVPLIPEVASLSFEQCTPLCPSLCLSFILHSVSLTSLSSLL